MRSPLTRWLAALTLLDGLGWGLGIFPSLLYIMRNHALQITAFSIRSLSGPFERYLGADLVFVLGITYVVVSLFKVLAAYWLWNGRRDGAVLFIVLLALSTIFWYGFALPFGPLLGLILIVLLVMAWKKLA